MAILFLLLWQHCCVYTGSGNAGGMSSSIDLSSLKEGGKLPESLKMQLITNAISKYNFFTNKAFVQPLKETNYVILKRLKMITTATMSDVLYRY